MAAHVCQDCGLLHDTPAAPGPDREVEIARINAERDKYVARVQARQTRDELDTAEEIAETEADAQVQSAQAVAEILTAEPDVADEPEPETVVVDAPEIDDEETDEEAPPPADDHQPTAPRKPRGLGFW